MARKRRRARINRFPQHIQRAYVKLLARSMERFAERIVGPLLRVLARELPALEIPDTRTDAPRDIFAVIERIREQIGGGEITASLVTQIKTHTLLLDGWSVSRVQEALRASISTLPGTAVQFVESVNIIGTPGNVPRALLDSAVKRNVELITTARRELFGRIEGVVRGGVQGGKGLKELTGEIQKITGQGVNRAKLIARDQTSKIFGEISGQRIEQAGFTHYIWLTVEDERVRDAHAERHGKVFTLARGTGIPGDAHPGEHFQCRCYREPSRGPEG